jgi:hypothetical protein
MRTRQLRMQLTLQPGLYPFLSIVSRVCLSIQEPFHPSHNAFTNAMFRVTMFFITDEHDG